MMVFYFDTEIFRMLTNHPFFGAVVQQMERVFDPKCPSAAVAFKNCRYYLYVNKEWIESQTERDITSVLVHEVLHVALGHTWRMEDVNVAHKMKNIAADLVVNQYLTFEKLDGAVTIDKYKFPPNLTVMEYVNLLKQLPNPPSDDDQDRGDANSHGYAAEQDDGSTSMKEVVGKNLIERAMSQAHGKIPANLESILQEILSKGKIPWTQIVRRFVDNSRRFLTESNRFKPNRRQPNNIMLSGKKRIDLSRLLIGIDTSGSVSDTQISYFLEEIYAIAATKTEITVVECDCNIQKVYTPKDQRNIQTKVKGRGGTDFDPVFKYAHEHKFKHVVYFTDLECNDPQPEYRHINTLWVVQQERFRREVSFGQVIAIEP